MEFIAEPCSRTEFVITCPEPGNYQIEYAPSYEREESERFAVDKLVQASIADPTALVPAVTIPAASELYKEFKLRNDIDEAARLKKDSLQTADQDLLSSLLAASSNIENAITEINLLIELTSTIQNNGNLTVLTSFQRELQAAAFALPLVQRCQLLADFYSQAANRIHTGIASMEATVQRRQQYASQLAVLCAKWPLVPAKGTALEAVAVDCSFGQTHLLTHLTLQDGQIAVKASGVNHTVQLSLVSKHGIVLAAVDAWTLLHPYYEGMLSNVMQECEERRHDTMARVWFQDILLEAMAIESRQMLWQGTSDTASGASAAIDELFQGKLNNKLVLNGLTEDRVTLELSESISLQWAFVPIASVSSGSERTDLQNMLNNCLVHGYSIVLSSQKQLIEEAKQKPAVAVGNKRSRQVTAPAVQPSSSMLLPVLNSFKAQLYKQTVRNILADLPAFPHSKSFELQAWPAKLSIAEKLRFMYRLQLPGMQVIIESSNELCRLAVYCPGEQERMAAVHAPSELKGMLSMEMANYTAR